MIKRIATALSLFAFGVIISVLAELELRRLIQALFKMLTFNTLHFYGKDFHLFSRLYYYLGFGLVCPLIWFSWTGLSLKQKTLDFLRITVIFFMALVVASWFASNAMLDNCISCNDGAPGVYYNDINYEAIIAASLLASMIPVGFRFFSLNFKP
jgi:hypothetical protein